MIQLFLIAKCMRDYFQASLSEAFEFFNHIMSLWERPRGAEAKLHFSGQPRYWSAICVGRLTEHGAVLPSWVFSNLLPLPPIRKEMISSWRRKSTHAQKKFSHWQLLRNHSIFMLSNLALAAHRHRGFNLFFLLCIVHRTALVRAIALFCVVF